MHNVPRWLDSPRAKARSIGREERTADRSADTTRLREEYVTGLVLLFGKGAPRSGFCASEPEASAAKYALQAMPWPTAESVYSAIWRSPRGQCPWIRPHRPCRRSGSRAPSAQRSTASGRHVAQATGGADRAAAHGPAGRAVAPRSTRAGCPAPLHSPLTSVGRSTEQPGSARLVEQRTPLGRQVFCFGALAGVDRDGRSIGLRTARH
jgi:hypothetical protein